MTLLSQTPSVLNTDLYQLTMAAGYHVHGLADQRATFELYVRRLPHQRSFLVAAGLEQALDYLMNLRFSPEEVDWLRTLPAFKQVPDSFFNRLRELRFTGDVWALPEGTVFFPYEPVLRISAPLIEAQLVETWLLAMLNYQTSVASKAARIRLAIQNMGSSASFVDFGSRRAHGPEAALLAARAAFIGGATGTSNVQAAQVFGLPVQGTAAHSWTMAFETEPEAFSAYRQVFPEHSTLLVDTYDTVEGIRNAIASGTDLKGIRLDSGDFLSLSRTARTMLDAAGMQSTKIVVSGDMNEFKVQDLLAAGAPVDIFGIGTELVTSLDAPSLGGVYKLVELETRDGRLRHALKLSNSKVSYPGCKQVWRKLESDGTMSGDLLGLAHERPEGEALLVEVLKAGQRLQPSDHSLKALQLIQRRTLSQLAALPESLQQLRNAEHYPVTLGAGLNELFDALKRQHESH